MYTFLSTSIPRSVNAERKAEYYQGLVNDLLRYNRKAASLSGHLYGFVYYFHKTKTQLDADNLSKPVWDALCKTAYADDNQIVFRSSGVFDLNSSGIDVLDLSNIPENILDDLLVLLDDDKKNHVIYVEMGKFDFDLFQFGFEK